MSALCLPAPGKLNLMLRVLGRRPDGYHELQTVYQFIDRCGWLRCAARADGKLRLHPAPSGWPLREDLIWRAGHALAERCGSTLGADIHYAARMPAGGGLGAASSAAATALTALNRLWGRPLGDDELKRIGRSLGADVPVFLYGRAAWGEGAGERLRPMEPPEPWYLVVCPPCAVPTREVFGSGQLTRRRKPITIRDFGGGVRDNDCEAVVRRRWPAVDRAMRWLAGEAGEARLSGTGACVFAASPSYRTAARWLSGAPSGFTGFVTKGRNDSPLRRMAAGASPSG